MIEAPHIYLNAWYIDRRRHIYILLDHVKICMGEGRPKMIDINKIDQNTSLLLVEILATVCEYQIFMTI